ncbi:MULTISPECIES: hypothetical protein [Rhizobium]|uniref:hypothetical protein n=1 Tax=Rhizobium TaxID=379 RepID=UPI0013F1788A|nr:MULTISPECIES: hypothetical protein [Rhizobium]MBY4593287.1 hypothetical protein [Rhizobium redzepovicii]MBY4617914.1 hypothetical protein [Rhizobium redzepovicii]ULJ81585.1 hypothetical protein MF410_26965 [Rhizobium sp. C104]
MADIVKAKVCPCSQVGYNREQLPEPFGIVVTGYRHLDIEDAICDLPVKVVYNADFRPA